MWKYSQETRILTCSQIVWERVLTLYSNMHPKVCFANTGLNMFLLIRGKSQYSKYHQWIKWKFQRKTAPWKTGYVIPSSQKPNNQSTVYWHVFSPEMAHLLLLWKLEQVTYHSMLDFPICKMGIILPQAFVFRIEGANTHGVCRVIKPSMHPFPASLCPSFTP